MCSQDISDGSKIRDNPPTANCLNYIPNGHSSIINGTFFWGVVEPVFGNKMGRSESNQNDIENYAAFIDNSILA